MSSVHHLLMSTLLAGSLVAHGAETPLNVALTNDDGWDAPGIRALLTVLRERGHHVTMVAPATQQSGSSAALNLSTIAVYKHADGEYSATLADANGNATAEGAEPLTSGLLAIDVATRLHGRRPDVLVSGINSGANAGSAAQHSGTVGAVIGALNRSLNGPVPGIAVSTDPPRCDAACVATHYRQVALYAADLLQHLQQKPAFLRDEPGLLPPGVGLNVNYPATTDGAVKGVRVAGQSGGFGIGGAARVLTIACPDCIALEPGGSAAAGMDPDQIVRDSGTDAPDNDVDAFYDGYITIVPIEGDYTADRHTRWSRVFR